MIRALSRVEAGEEDPDCRTCGGLLKSATISFGQGLVERDLSRAFAAAEECELLLAIGTTLAVYPIASMVPIAKEAGARIVIVNGEPRWTTWPTRSFAARSAISCQRSSPAADPEQAAQSALPASRAPEESEAYHPRS